MANTIDLFSYLPDLEVTANEVLRAELMAQQIIKAKYPDMDTRKGMAVNDLVIRPNAHLLAMINKAMMVFFSQNSLAGVTDKTPTVFVDKLMSNWFLSRKVGTKAVINARLYFAKAKSVSLMSDTFFSIDGELKFFPTSGVAFSADQLTYDISANQYYVDVDLIAEQSGKAYNVTTGSMLYFSNFDPYFLHAEINYLSSAADDIETNTKFIARASTAISTRNLINLPSISGVLMDKFSFVNGVLVVGMSDNEMVRDQFKVLIEGVTDPVWTRLGGCTDVYCRTPLASSIVQLKADSKGKINLTGSIYKFERSYLSGGADNDTIPVLQYSNASSLTQSGGLATFVSATNHNLSTGDTVTIVGATQSTYNGEKLVTVVNPTTFTFKVSSTAVSPATGTIRFGVPTPSTTTNYFYHEKEARGYSYNPTSGVLTVTLNNNGLLKTERVKLSGLNVRELNGVFCVDQLPDRDTITLKVDTGLAPLSGTLKVGSIDRQGDVGFSSKQHLVVDYGSRFANGTASFVIYFHQGIDGLQEFLTDSTRRVACSDPLARGFNLALLDMEVTGYNGPAPDAKTCSDVVTAYLSQLNAGEPFVMSELTSLLSKSGISSIKTPLTINYKKYWRDQLGETSGTITDTMVPNDSTNVFLLNSLTTNSQALTNVN